MIKKMHKNRGENEFIRDPSILCFMRPYGLIIHLAKLVQLRLQGFPFSEEEGDRINTGQPYDCKDNSADYIVGPAEYAGDQIIPEKTDQSPVDRADDN